MLDLALGIFQLLLLAVGFENSRLPERIMVTLEVSPVKFYLRLVAHDGLLEFIWRITLLVLLFLLDDLLLQFTELVSVHLVH